MIDKKKFHRELREFVERNNIKFASSIDDPDATTIVCTAVEEFDPVTNEVWNVPANRSYARDIVCDECKRQVVMSDGMFKMYSEAKSKPLVGCGSCVLGIKK